MTSSSVSFLCVLCVICGSPLFVRAEKLEITNNRPFPVAMPWRLHDGTRIYIDAPANGTQTDTLNPNVAVAFPLALVQPASDGLVLSTYLKDVDGMRAHGLGTLDWDIIVEPVEKKASDEEAAKNKRDYARIFK